MAGACLLLGVGIVTMGAVWWLACGVCSTIRAWPAGFRTTKRLPYLVLPVAVPYRRLPCRLQVCTRQLVALFVDLVLPDVPRCLCPAPALRRSCPSHSPAPPLAFTDDVGAGRSALMMIAARLAWWAGGYVHMVVANTAFRG